MLAKEKALPKEGYTLRPVRPGDGELAAGVINEFTRRVQGFTESTPAELENFWTTPGVNPADDIRLLIDLDGKPLGYVEALTMAQPPTNPMIWIKPHPDHVQDGGAAALFDWAVARCSQALDRVPDELRVAIGTFCPGGYEPIKTIFETRGFKLIRHSFQMEISFAKEPGKVEWPAGIRLKPFDVEEDAEAVYRAHDEAFSDHYGHQDQPFETGFPRFKHLMIEDKEFFDASFWFIAMDGDQIAGYSLCRISPQEEPPIGWVSILGVRRPWRKRGLGMTLLQHSFGEFYRRGLRKAGLGVDGSSLTGALGLYERAGMKVAQVYDRYEKELRPGKELMTTELSE